MIRTNAKPSANRNAALAAHWNKLDRAEQRRMVLAHDRRLLIQSFGPGSARADIVRRMSDIEVRMYMESGGRKDVTKSRCNLERFYFDAYRPI